MKISIGSDHGGWELKARIIDFLKDKGHEVINRGCDSADSVDYPDFGIAVGKDVASGTADRGIVICKSGIGISIAANKVAGVRAALCLNEEMARLSRLHNNANVLALGDLWCGNINVEQLVDTWLSTDFEGGRHTRRVDKISAQEKEA